MTEWTKGARISVRNVEGVTEVYGWQLKFGSLYATVGVDSGPRPRHWTLYCAGLQPGREDGQIMMPITATEETAKKAAIAVLMHELAAALNAVREAAGLVDPCECCGGSLIERTVGRDNNVLEGPCSMCDGKGTQEAFNQTRMRLWKKAAGEEQPEGRTTFQRISDVISHNMTAGNRLVVSITELAELIEKELER